MAIKITGKKLTNELVRDLYTKGNLLSVSNIFFFKWESDVFNISKSDITSEFEVKVSRSDFFADFNKREKHKALNDAHEKGIVNEEMPQFFYYAAPEGLITVEDLPDYAGLIERTPYGSFKKIKSAPKLHDVKFKVESWREIAMKFYYKSL